MVVITVRAQKTDATITAHQWNNMEKQQKVKRGGFKQTYKQQNKSKIGMELQSLS